MRVLILTKVFPNRIEPLSSPFNLRQFRELSRLCHVEILAAIPWFPGAGVFARWSRAGRLLGVPPQDRIDGLRVHHPRFVFVPKVAPGITGPLYAASLATTALRYRGRVDVVLGSWAYPDGYAAVVLGDVLGTPAVVKLHGSDINVVAKLPGPRRALEWALPRAERIVAVSRPLRDAVIALGVEPDRIDVVPNGIDRSRFRPQERLVARRALGLPSCGGIVLYIGNVERHKGVLDLVHAFAALEKRRKDVSLVVLGDESAMGECRRLAALLGVNASFVGTKAHDEIPQWLAASDVVTLPSWNEGTPNVVLEALACGRRVVATRVGGIPDLVLSDTEGTLVPPHDPALLAAALEDALSRHYDAEGVSEALGASDWPESARRLHSTLAAAVESRGRRAA